MEHKLHSESKLIIVISSKLTRKTVTMCLLHETGFLNKLYILRSSLSIYTLLRKALKENTLWNSKISAHIRISKNFIMSKFSSWRNGTPCRLLKLHSFGAQRSINEISPCTDVVANATIFEYKNFNISKQKYCNNKLINIWKNIKCK